MTSSLVNNFKFSVKLACFGGIYIQGAENLFRFKKITEIFFRMNFYMCVGYINFQVAQESYNAIYNEEMPTSLKAYLSVALITVETTALRLMAIRFKRNEMNKMIQLWNESFKDSLFPNYREEELKIIRTRIEKTARYQIFGFMIPMILWPLAPIITGKELLTNAFPGDHDASPAFELIFVHHLMLAYYLATGWVAFDNFFFLIMATILMELGHLKRSLKEIFATIQMNEKGKIFYADKKTGQHSSKTNFFDPTEECNEGALFDENMDRVRRILKIWISQYSDLINYSNAVQKFYAPILAGQFFYLAAYGCATLYMALVIDLEAQNIAASIVYYGNSYLMTYVMCSLGNQIYDESQTLAEEVFGQDWTLYPKDVRQSLLMIITVTTKRPIQIHAFHVLKLNVNTFGKLLQLTYSFLAFMAQMRGKYII